MNGILLDTHILLWWLADAPALPGWMAERLADPDTPCYVSAATVWEISIKRAVGKLEAPPDLVPILAEEGFVHLDIALAHASSAAALPLLHRDPFDRMLVAQARRDRSRGDGRNGISRQSPKDRRASRAAWRRA